jgi:hypothetical protein
MARNGRQLEHASVRITLKSRTRTPPPVTIVDDTGNSLFRLGDPAGSAGLTVL